MNFPVPSPNYYQPQPVYFQRNISIQETRLTNSVYQPEPEMMPSNNIPQYQHPYQQMSSPTPEPINTTNLQPNFKQFPHALAVSPRLARGMPGMPGIATCQA